MTPEPPSPWLAIAASVASEALLAEEPTPVIRRLLRGLMALHGLHGALVARRPFHSAALLPLGMVGHPEQGATAADAAGAWARASAAHALGEAAAASLVEVAESLAGGGEAVLLLAGVAAAARVRAIEDARSALQLAIRIDEAHRQRNADKEERDRLKSIIEATEAGTWERHVPTGAARLNERWAAIAGRDLAELEPISVDTWSSSVHPDDLPATVERLENHLSGRAPRYEAIYRLRHKDGSWIWVQDRGRIVHFTRDGRPEWMVGSHVDISPLKQYEAQLKAAIEALKTNSALLDASGRMALVGAWTYTPGASGPMWSDVVCLIHEVPSGHTPSLSEAIEYYDEAGRATIQQAVASCLRDGTPWDLELPIITAKGNRRWVRAQGEAVHHDGAIVRILGAFQDITERRALQDALQATNANLETKVRLRTQELEQAIRIAEDASRAKDEFLTNISHELRSPLHSILGFTRLLIEDGEIPPETRDNYLRKVERSASNLLSLVNDLLDSAKIESKSFSIQLARCDLVEIVRNVIGEFQSEGGTRSSIKAFLPPVAPCNGDAFRLAQVLRNLVANAIRFSPTGSRVQVAVERSEGGWTMAVRDRGPGVPPGELETIFERFSQSSTTKTGAGGTGLGLHIARGIIRSHGGTLTARNRPDGGAAFEAFIPDPK